MKRKGMFLDSFCGALKQLPKGQRTVQNALRTLAESPRVSTFERGAPWLESMIRALLEQGLVIEDKTERYPWHRFTLTAKGREVAG